MRLLNASALWKRLSLLACIVATAVVVPVMVAAQEHTAHTVVIRQMRFNPPQLTIQPGDTVEWKNEDIFSHTVTADDGSFDSGLIPPQQSWKTTISTGGRIRYHCRPHPNMAATLLVSSSGHNGSHEAMQSERYRSLKWSLPSSPEQIHPILVNFTAALLPLALASDVLGRIFRRRSLHNAAFWMVLYAAAITPLTVAAGWWWRHTAGPTLPARLIAVHQWLGTSAAVAFVVLAVWRWRIQRREVPPTLTYLSFTAILVLALVYQGSLGGSMVFGK